MSLQGLRRCALIARSRSGCLRRTIYNMCTQKPPHDYSEQLYGKYKEAFDTYIVAKVWAGPWSWVGSTGEAAGWQHQGSEGSLPKQGLPRRAGAHLGAGAAVAARAPRRGAAPRAVQAMGQPQADGPLALALLQLPGQVNAAAASSGRVRACAWGCGTRADRIDRFDLAQVLRAAPLAQPPQGRGPALLPRWAR